MEDMTMTRTCPVKPVALIAAIVISGCTAVPKNRSDAGQGPPSNTDADDTDSLSTIEFALPQADEVEACWGTNLAGADEDGVVDLAVLADETSVTALFSGTIFIHGGDGTLLKTVQLDHDTWEAHLPVRAVEALPDGGFLVSGIFAGTAVFGQGEANETTLVSQGLLNTFLARYDSNGFLIWARSDGGTGISEANGLAVLADGTYLLVGRFDETATFGAGEPNETVLEFVDVGPNKSIFLAHYLDDGTLSWARVECIGCLSNGRELAVLPDGSFVVTGMFWESATLGQGQSNETVLAWEQPPDTCMPDPGVDMTGLYVARFDADGFLQWAGSADGTLATTITSARALPDGAIVVSGFFYDVLVFGHGGGTLRSWCDNSDSVVSVGASMFVSGWSADGIDDWGVAPTCVSEEMCQTHGSRAAVTEDGSILVSGATQGAVRFGLGDAADAVIDDEACFAAIYSPTGNLESLVRIGHEWEDLHLANVLPALSILTDGDFLIGGSFSGSVEIDGQDDTTYTLVAENESDGFLVRVCP